jgi:hypothetical protein
MDTHNKSIHAIHICLGTIAVLACLMLTSCSMPSKEGPPMPGSQPRQSNTEAPSENEINYVENMSFTLQMPYGDRTGIYTGEVVNGIPNGQGAFISKNPEGIMWTYTGELKDGQFNGNGIVEWESGDKREGTYQNGSLVEGKIYNDIGALIFEGALNNGEEHAQKFTDYLNAIHAFLIGNPEQADILLQELGDYKDAADYLTAIPFQGEWKERGSKSSTRIFIKGWEYISVHFSTAYENEVSDIFIFSLELNDDGSLTRYNQHGQMRGGVYNFDGNGDLINTENDKITIYDKVSNSIDIPTRRGEPQIGMTEQQVLDSTWGFPSKRNTTETVGYFTEQWVYNDRGYIYFENGFVTAIQTR